MNALSDAYSPHLPDLTPALRELFGFPAFRAGQEEIVRRAVEGRDTLALMPTGAGKSLCYQLAAMLRPTPTLVVSPLIALMKDQIDNLPPAVAGQATLINSSLDPSEAADRLRGLAAGDYKLLYAAPERLRQKNFVQALRSVELGLVVIDEVHCVSMWGHDFRPDYMFIRRALKDLGDPAVLGLTATATRATEGDIARSLDRELEVVRASVVRPNLRYEVEHVENEEARLRTALELAKRFAGPGIIYARSREKCEQVAQVLERNGVRALHYHAGLDGRDRTRVQEEFLGDRSRVIVATTAFGMGIDKRDIRWVLLYNFPNSLESYVQMVGRAGRDGEPSTCVLLASSADATNLRRFAKADIPSRDDLRAVYRALRRFAEDGVAEATAEELAAEAGLRDDTMPRVLVGMLERTALVRRDYDAGRAMRVKLTLPPPDDAAQRIEQLLGAYEQQATARAERMVAYADARACRHQQVASFFGESVRVPCGMCDVCAPGPRSNAADAPEASPLPDDIARTIVDAVEGLRWPMGLKGLTATLRGSLSAPRSAQRSPAFGVLAAAKESTVKRWVQTLLDGGHLEFFESEDGYRLIRLGDATDLPRLTGLSVAPARRRERDGATGGGAGASPDDSLADEDGELFERLRAWRAEKARELSLPPYTIAHDRALREIAALRPTEKDQLLDVTGIGPAKVEKYGDDLLTLLRWE
jgi:ATP-dependent DNA helicase RecQ